MKKYMLGAAALIAMAAPGIAHADDAGSLGIHYANLDPDNSDNVDTYGLDLGFVHSLDGGLAVQATASSDRIDTGSGNLGVGYAALALGAHVDGGSYYGWLTHETFIGDAWGVGLGGKWDVMSQAVVDASVGYADADSTGITNLNLDGTWFFSDDLGVGAQVGYIDFDGNNATTYGLNGTYRFAGTPIALNLGYQHIDADGGGDANRWSLGFQWQFGSSSAHDNASHGATWNGAERQFQDTLFGL